MESNRSIYTQMKLTQTVLLFIVAIVVCAGSVVADQPPDSVAGRDTVGVTAAGQAEELAAESPPERQAEEQPPDAFDFLLTGKYLGFLFLMVAGLILVLGRWVNTWVRVVMMLAAFVLFGLDYFFPLHPSPMCGFTKLFMFRLSHGVFFPAFIAMFAAMIIPNLIGKKLYCGWVCPLGALQELVNKVPFRYRWRQFNFTAFNSVRMFLLVMFFLTLFLVSEQIGVYNIYQPINFSPLEHRHAVCCHVGCFGHRQPGHLSTVLSSDLSDRGAGLAQRLCGAGENPSRSCPVRRLYGMR